MDGARPAVPGAFRAGFPSSLCSPVTVTRIGTQVVVRLSGDLDDRLAERLDAALDEVADLALTRVLVDLDDAGEVGDAGLDFLVALGRRWSLRLLNAPSGLRRRLAAHG